MSAVGGDIIEVTYNHPTLGTGTLFPKSNEDSTYDVGGFRSNDDANMVDGGGNFIDQLNRQRWSFELVVAWDKDLSPDTLTAISNLSESPELAEWTFTHINGTVYGGTGKPVGDIQGSGNAATISFKVAGGGKLTTI